MRYVLTIVATIIAVLVIEYFILEYYVYSLANMH